MKNDKKSFYQRWKIILLVLSFILFLTGCSSGHRAQMSPIDENSTGFWDHTILYNLSRLIIWFSNLFGGSYGLGIIIVTIIIRLLLTPLYKYQLQNTEKMQQMQPELTAIQKKYASRDPETQAKLEEETKKVYDKYDYNMWSTFIPLLIQLPILTALYQAIVRTEVLSNGSFLWMELGKPDPYFILPLLAALSTWYSTYLSTIASGQKSGTNTAMQWVMPIMMFLITMNMPSSISLYLVTTNVFSVIQLLVISNPYKKRRERQEEEKKQANLERRLEKAKRNPRRKKRRKKK